MTRPVLWDDHYYTDPLSQNPVIGTKFKPEPPFDQYLRGVVCHDKENDRRVARLYKRSEKVTGPIAINTNILVGRYLYAVRLFRQSGLLIPDDYEVDHIDENRWNDTYSNFQLLTKIENLQKTQSYRSHCRLCYVLICPVCLNKFDAIVQHTQLRPENRHLVFYCSRRCKVIFRSTLRPYKNYITLRQWIAEKQLHQIIRVWSPGNTRELVEIVCFDMLLFDLEKACGHQVAYDTPQLLPIEQQCRLVSSLRREGLSWKDIALRFYMPDTWAHQKFKYVPLTDDVSAWTSYLREIRLSDTEDDEESWY